MFGKKLAPRLSPLAVSDLEDIWLHAFRQWSLEQADDDHQRIMKAVEGLASGRIIWQKSDALMGYWKYPVGRQMIYFHNTTDFLDVIRILHKEMDIRQYAGSEGEPA